MKKTYIVPEFCIVEVKCEGVLLEGSKYDEGSDGTQLVKEDYMDASSRSSHSIWDDDWSE